MPKEYQDLVPLIFGANKKSPPRSKIQTKYKTKTKRELSFKALMSKEENENVKIRPSVKKIVCL